MRIAYISRDEVNRALAVRMAAKLGTVVCNLAANDPPADGEFDAVLYNLDEAPLDLRRVLVQGLTHGAHEHLVAVHGYDLSDQELDALRRNGVPAARRLEPDLLRCLRRAVQQRTRAVVDHDGGTDLTCVNLVK
jgi:hypothetical protein